MKLISYNIDGTKLSFIDQVSPQFFMPWVLFYPKDTNFNLNNHEQRERIKKSLSEALTQFYPLAGRVKDGLYVECNDNESKSFYNKFLPYQLADVNDLLAAVQVTSFNCGGIVIGLEISHKVADALSFFLFLNSWAATARGGSNILSPWLDAATIFPPATHLPAFNPHMGMSKNKTVLKRIVFDASAVATIRAKYSSSNKDIEYPRPTRVEALSSFIYSRFIAATDQTEANPNKVYTIILAVDLRRRLDPPLQQNCFGNLSQPTNFAKVNMDYVKKLWDSDGRFNYRTENAEKLNRGEVVPMVFTSLCRFPIYEADFGWGKPVWVGSTKMLYHNIVTSIDTKSGDGIEAWICLKEEDMVKFEMDKQVLTYVSLAKSCVF
ncbi:hypothetical protein RGQ29_015326 [Quercus rubra]|uniref:Uncharacterized protein n=1 Tax=Quercus rubra TaxID=3512 RepID=A0AAN7J480_QUERU|nr:hypothetical protein RGQ29_015326 [Quercus rubra]